HSWEYRKFTDPEKSIFLPPNLPLPAIVDAMRFLVSLKDLDGDLEVELLLPPKNHAATIFISETRLIGLADKISYSNNFFDKVSIQSSDNVLVPLTFVGDQTGGQLADDFFRSFEKLLKVGRIELKWRSPLKRIIMEAAENADTWGNGRGYVSVFLRQEGLGKMGFHETEDFVPERDTHLFIHVFSAANSLGSTLNMSEQEAANEIQSGRSSRLSAGGQGIPYIVENTVSNALGTVLINSGGFNRIISPNGMIYDSFSAGMNFLPGVHLGLILPLAVLSDERFNQQNPISVLQGLKL
ncbi:MAG: hypothetical protein AAF705_13415, partial [Bacteroidota bacterium]